MPHASWAELPRCPFEQLTKQTPKQKQKQRNSSKAGKEGKGESEGKAAEKHWPNVKWKKNLATTKQSETFSPANSISSNPWNQANLFELLLFSSAELQLHSGLGWPRIYCALCAICQLSMQNAKQIFHANRAQLAWEFSRFLLATFLVMKNAG